MHVPDTDPSRRVVPVLSNRSDEPRRHPGLGGGAKRVSGVCRHHVLIEKGLVHPPPTLSLPFLRPPIPCWLGGCSSRVAYSKITAARNFLYSAPIGICRCASSPIGPDIRPQNRGCAPACALTSSFWHQLSPRPAAGSISLAHAAHRDVAHASGQHSRIAWVPSGANTRRRALALLPHTT